MRIVRKIDASPCWGKVWLAAPPKTLRPRRSPGPFIENVKQKDLSYFELDKIDSIKDYINARALSDSSALKKKFSNEEIFKKYLPKNISCKKLYSLAEQIRYETLGSRMLKGIEKNLRENYKKMRRL